MSEFTLAEWRLLIEDEPRSGAANMALDQAIAESCAAGESPPTVRFYRWQPPAISLGRHQKADDINFAAAAERGYDVVRRSTGGRAILHVDELTYSVAAPASEPRVGGSVMDAYLRLSNGLLTGLRNLGLAADKAGGDVRAGRDVSAACFEVPSAYEITAHGRKLIGSAQSRRAGYVLQHGTLPLVGDITRLIDVLVLPQAQADALHLQLQQRAGTLAQALAVAEDSELLDFARIAQSLAKGFESALNITLKASAYRAAEMQHTAELIRSQYANEEWTLLR